jgi:MarR family transcriptional regulator for hemolysin
LLVSHDLSLDFARTPYPVAQARRREVDRKVSSFGLTRATSRSSFHWGWFDNGGRQTDIARLLGVAGPSLVRLPDVFEKNNLIERIEASDDRRSQLLWVTREGRSLYREEVQTYRTISAGLPREVGEEERALCCAVIGKIERAMAVAEDGDRDRS